MRKMPGVIAALVLSVCMMGLLTGCGSTNTNIDAAAEQLKALDYEGALHSLDLAEEAGENNRLLYRARGITYMAMTEYESAVYWLKEALWAGDGFVQPIDYDINYYLASSLVKLGRYDEAEERYDAILSLRNDAEALFLRGCTKLWQNRYLDAKEDFDAVIAMEPDNYDRLLDIYVILLDNNYKEAGLDYLDNALLHSENMSTYDRGRIYYYMGEYQSAAVSLENARQTTDNSNASLYLGLAYEAVGEYNYASNVYESCIAKYEPTAILYNQLGLCCMKMGDYESALSYFQSGMQLEDKGVLQNLAYNEAICQEYLGQYQKALVLLTGYVKNYPDDQAAKRELDFLSTR